jgi:DNA-binding response OmpR family regulator
MDPRPSRCWSAGGSSLVVLDLLLCAGGGEDVIAYLQRAFPASVRRIVIITATAQMRLDALPGDVCRVLRKPFDLDVFIASVRTCSE